MTQIRNPDSIEVDDVVHIGSSRFVVVEVDVIDEMLVPTDDGYERRLTAGVRAHKMRRHKMREELLSYERLAQGIRVTRRDC